MSRYVLDAPTLLHVVRASVEVHPDHRLVAPSLVRSQALTLLLGEVRSGALAEREALLLHTALTEIKLRLLGDRVSRQTAFRIALEQGWETTYDAEVVAVTKLQADALVTVDGRLASLAEGLVPLAPVEALRLPDDG